MKSPFTLVDHMITAVLAAAGIAIKTVIVPLAQMITGPLLIPGGVVAGGFYMLFLVLADRADRQAGCCPAGIASAGRFGHDHRGSWFPWSGQPVHLLGGRFGRGALAAYLRSPGLLRLLLLWSRLGSKRGGQRRGEPGHIPAAPGASAPFPFRGSPLGRTGRLGGSHGSAESAQIWRLEAFRGALDEKTRQTGVGYLPAVLLDSGGLPTRLGGPAMCLCYHR